MYGVSEGEKSLPLGLKRGDVGPDPGVWILRGRNTLFDELAAHLRALGIDVGASTTMEEALDELRRTRPDAAAALAPLIGMYEEERFSTRRGRAREIRRALANLS